MAKRIRCSNHKDRDAVIESVSRKASKVAFCEDCKPKNWARSKDYKKIPPPKKPEPEVKAESLEEDNAPSPEPEPAEAE